MSRWSWLGLALGLALAGCSGSGGGATGRDVIEADEPELAWSGADARDEAAQGDADEPGPDAKGSADLPETSPGEVGGTDALGADATTPDGASDLSDGSASEATEPDAPADVTVSDAPSDVTVPDAGDPDLPSPCPAEGDVATLKTCPQGDLEPAYLLRDVVVTYRYADGFFVQDASGAILVYAGQATWALPAVGSVLDLPVQRLSDYEGTAEVTRAEAPTVTGQQDAAPLALDLSAGTEPGEALESRLVRVTDATVVEGAGTNWMVRYGTSGDVALRVDLPGGLCADARLTLSQAVILQSGAAYVLASYHLDEDLGALDDTGCDHPDTTNWGFELDDPSDPPPGFEKATGFFTATRTTEHAHQGQAACALTWKNNANQDLYQQLFVPASPGQSVSFHVWALDTDDDGRVRAALDFFDAQKTSLGKQYGELISVDGPGWQDLSIVATAPATTAWVRAFVRMYDVSGGTDGTATVWIDDWTLPVE